MCRIIWWFHLNSKKPLKTLFLFQINDGNLPRNANSIHKWTISKSNSQIHNQNKICLFYKLQSFSLSHKSLAVLVFKRKLFVSSLKFISQNFPHLPIVEQLAVFLSSMDAFTMFAQKSSHPSNILLKILTSKMRTIVVHTSPYRRN